MRQGKKPKPVTFFAEDEFELVRGLILPAGHYEGLERVSAFSTMQSNRASPPRYDLQFSREQLRDVGNYAARDEEMTTFDVTQQVREGMLVIV